MSLPLRMTMLASGAGVGFALLVGTEFPPPIRRQPHRRRAISIRY